MDKPKSASVIDNPWQRLREYTPARIALGRAGVSLPTRPLLEFQFAHARARDAVHHPVDSAILQKQLTEKGHEAIVLHSAAADRQIYLQRPDLGRRLDRDSRRCLEARTREGYDVAFVIADGLSAFAIHQNAVPFFEVMMTQLNPNDWRVAPVALVEQGRVAIGDEIGELLGATMVVLLVGERPGLSSPDSLGIYLTYRPRVGLTDEARNCISNVRRGGLSFHAAAHKLFYLMGEARRREFSGVNLKDEAEEMEHALNSPTTADNFLVRGWLQEDG